MVVGEAINSEMCKYKIIDLGCPFQVVDNGKVDGYKLLGTDTQSRTLAYGP